MDGKPGPGPALAAAMLFLLAGAPCASSELAVSIEWPFADEVVSGWLNVTGSSSGGAGGVELSLDGGNWIVANGTSSWYLLWNASNATEGTHTFLVRAYTGSVRSNTASVQVTVNNTPPSQIGLTLDLSAKQVYAGDDFIVSGMARYDNGVRAVNESVRLNFDGRVYSSITDRRGFYSAALTAPQKDGRLQVNSFLQSRGLSASVTGELDVRFKNPPELSVANVSFSPGQPYGGQEVTAGVIVRNGGGMNATARVEFSVAGLETRNVSVSVPAGGSWPAEVKWTFPSGSFNISVAVQNCTPQDPELSNNIVSGWLKVYARPDLIMSDMVFSNSRPFEGNMVTLQARIRNGGEKEASGKLRFYDGNPAPSTQICELHITVPANTTKMFTTDWKPTKGTRTVYAVISDVAPQEKDDTNNQFSRALTVRVLPPPPPAQTPGFGVLMVVAAIAISGLCARRRLAILHGECPPVLTVEPPPLRGNTK